MDLRTPNALKFSVHIHNIYKNKKEKQIENRIFKKFEEMLVTASLSLKYVGIQTPNFEKTNQPNGKSLPMATKSILRRIPWN